jgi:hypothetical protein
MRLRWFALLVHPRVALLLNLFPVFRHLHCLALGQVLILAFFSRSDFVAGVLTLLFYLTFGLPFRAILL